MINYLKMNKYKSTLILVSFFWTSICFAQNSQDTLKVLFVGNSYTYYYNLTQLVSLISDSTQTKLITSKSTIGGARLSDHWRGKKGLQTKALIRNGNFDIVVLQDHSMSAIEQPDSLLFYSKKFSNLIKKNGAQPYLYSTWAREKAPQYQQETITKVYNQAGQDNNAGIVHVGEVWNLSKKLRPGIKLYLSDGSHPSPLGSFLTACAFVKALTKELPEVLPNKYQILDVNGESVNLANQNPQDIRFCLAVVKEITN